jgi:hypothetical protein
MTELVPVVGIYKDCEGEKVVGPFIAGILNGHCSLISFHRLLDIHYVSSK